MMRLCYWFATRLGIARCLRLARKSETLSATRSPTKLGIYRSSPGREQSNLHRPVSQDQFIGDRLLFAGLLLCNRHLA